MVVKIDFHTHILPEIDDGSRSIEMSRTMLSGLRAQQVEAVVLTPHYYSHQKPISEFILQQQRSYEMLRCSLTEPTPDLLLGAEVYFSDYLFNNRDLSSLCIQGTRTMLLELPYNKTIDDRILDKVDRLIGEYAITPVIAHVERYPSLIRNKRLLDRLMDMGCVLQVNLSSFTSFGRWRLTSLAKKGYFGAVGTDAHNVSSRPADYNTGYRYLERALSVRQLEEIQYTMAALIGLK